MEKLIINIPDGYEIDKFDEESGEVTFKLKKPKYPTHIGQVPLPAISHYLNSSWKICTNNHYDKTRTDITLGNLAKKEYAEALVALAQLITLRDEYNRLDGFVPTFSSGVDKYCLAHAPWNKQDIIRVERFNVTHHAFAFKTSETAELFLKTFEQLINTAKILI